MSSEDALFARSNAVDQVGLERSQIPEAATIPAHLSPRLRFFASYFATGPHAIALIQEVLEGPEDKLDSRWDALIREVDALLEGEEGEKRRKQGEQGLLDFQNSLTARGQGSAGGPNGANETTLPESGLCWEVERLRLDLEAGPCTSCLPFFLTLS